MQTVFDVFGLPANQTTGVVARTIAAEQAGLRFNLRALVCDVNSHLAGGAKRRHSSRTKYPILSACES